jgi:Cof subfamily protein (haloacid dehalogenase superfamily)
MQFKLFISDFDGTLSDGNVSPKPVADAIKEYQSKGGIFALCTGRPTISAKKTMDDCGINPDAIVSFQGADVFINGEFGYRAGINSNLSSKIVKALRENFENNVCLFFNDDLYIEGQNPFTNAYSAFYKKYGGKTIFVEDLSKFILEQNSYASKIVVLKEPNEDVSKMYEFLEKNFGELVAVNSGASFIVEIISKEYTKYTASQFLAKKFGVLESETITVGDSTNDLPLLKYGFGVAVGNAEEQLKKIAKLVTVPVQEMPVKVLIDDILNGKIIR